MGFASLRLRGESAFKRREGLVSVVVGVPGGDVVATDQGSHTSSSVDTEEPNWSIAELTPSDGAVNGIYRGQKLVNYVGHGSVDQWRAGLLTSADALALRNQRLPVFILMTCLNGFFNEPASDSLAESLIRAEQGGAVAVWASSGLTSPDQQAVMNQEFYKLVFSVKGGPALGDAARRAKLVVDSTDVRRTWVLLGDPSMKVK